MLVCHCRALSERDIRGDSLYSVTERDAVSCLWVESITVNVASHYLRARALLNVFGQISEVIERLAKPGNLKRCYALAATSAGINLVKRFGFEVASEGSRRPDGHDLYCASYAVIKSKSDELFARSGNK